MAQTIKFNCKSFCKIANDSFNQKFLCFLQDIIANSTTVIKSHLSASSCEEIKKIEEVFLSNAQPNNTEAGNLIYDHVANQTID